MLRMERLEKILDILEKNRFYSVQSFSKLFNVSISTIKRDLDYLKKERYIKRIYGGAELISLSDSNHLLQNSYHPNNLGKQQNKYRESIKNDICVLGSFNVDLVAHVPDFPKPSETLLSTLTMICPGGKGANQAISASNAGGNVTFVTKLGNDDFGKIGKNFLESSDINKTKIFIDSRVQTGTAVIYVSEEHGQNMIAVTPGANEQFNHNEIKTIGNYIKDTSILLMQLEINDEAIKKALNLAKMYGKKIILNPAPYKHNIKPYLHLVNIITPNEIEASLLSGINVIDYDTAREAAKKISKENKIATVIITLGDKGVLVYSDNQVEVIPAIDVVPVDTTGAGDAFNGALVAMLSRDIDLIDAVRFANIFASLAVIKKGASNIPTYEEFKEHIKHNNYMLNINLKNYFKD